MNVKTRICVYCFLVAGLAQPAWSASGCDAAVNINADYSDTSISDGQTILRGNVVITHCDLKINADEAVIYTSERQIQKVELTGTPVRVDQNSGTLGKVNATSDEVAYDVESAVMVFTGNAHIAHSQGEVNGDKIRYEIENDRFQGGGDDKNGRIQIRLEAPGASRDAETAAPEDT